MPAKELFDWHNRLGAFERLTPTWEKVRVLRREGGVSDGGKLTLEVKQGPFRRRWVAVHQDFVPDRQFVDEQVQGPFSKWVHTHQFLPESETTSLLLDSVDYNPPLFFLGRWAAGGYIRRKLERLFQFRHARTRMDLGRAHPFTARGPLKIAITGSTGLIGKNLSAFLRGLGHEVRPLVRRAPKLESAEIFWDPIRKELDRTAVENLDAVIHLAGENIGAGRWTPSREEAIFKSRVDGTRFLSETLASLKRPPKVFVTSSAIGFYGNRGEEVLTESSQPGEGFLASVCRAWEEAAQPAQGAVARVVNLRTGIVLTPQGGALAKMLPPFLMGVGGRVGLGSQWMSWISLEDLLGIFHFALQVESLSGPVNAVAPGSVPNSEFVKTLGKVLGRPAFSPLPAFLVRAIFGKMGRELLLEGQKVAPRKLEEAGFSFLFPELESAFRWELGR